MRKSLIVLSLTLSAVVSVNSLAQQHDEEMMRKHHMAAGTHGDAGSTGQHGDAGSAGSAGQHGDAGSHGDHGSAGNTGGHGQHMAMQPDLRIWVKYPKALREHTLASMRQHLETVQAIQVALAQSQFDAAADLAEKHLGMSSLHDHKASENAQFMPPEMARIGTNMHRAASQFAVVARDASVSGDLKATLAALSNVTAQCVACHAGYRLQ